MSKIGNNIFIGGTGQVAWALGRMLVQNGQRVYAVVGRSVDATLELAAELSANACRWEDLTLEAGDCLILAVKDDAIATCASLIPPSNAFVFHCAGAVSHHVLKTCGPHIGVMYPLQSLRKDIRVPHTVPFLLTTSTPEAYEVAEALVAHMGCRAQQVSDEERLRYHLAAVLVNNLTNHLFSLAHAFCGREGIDFAQLIPLIQETAARLDYAAPAALQTGPAVRGDLQTKLVHEQLLASYPELLDWYRLSWEQIRARLGH